MSTISPTAPSLPSSPTSPTSLLHALAEQAVNDCALKQRGEVVLHFADTLTAALVGQNLVESQKIRSLAGVNAQDPFDALSLSASIRMTEIDDIDRASGVTVSAIVVPAALSASSLQTATSSEFFDALYVGYQCTLKVALAMGGANLMGKGLWPSYLVASLGSAVTMGRLLKLTPTQMKNAMALALAQTPRGVGRSQGDWPGRWLLFGQALERGRLCANAALNGFEADHDLLTADWLFGIGAEHSHVHALTQDIQVGAISFKPYCAAKQTLSCIGALQKTLQMVLQQGLDMDAIDRIEVAVPAAYAAMIDREPYHVSRLASMVSVKWQLALAALRPSGLSDSIRLYTQNTQDTTSLERLMAKMAVITQHDLATPYPAQWPGRVTVVVGERQFEDVAHFSDGDPEHGVWGQGQVLDKAKRFGLEPAQLKTLEGFLSAPEDDPSFQPRLERLKRQLAHSG